jgi:hypothetical protein
LFSDSLAGVGSLERRGVMARKLSVLAALVAVLALSFSILAPASSDTRYERKTIRLAERVDDDVEYTIDVGEKGFSVGDYFVISGDRLYRPDRETRVGTANGDCMVVTLDPETERAEAECDITIDLPGGDITVEGTLDFAKKRVAVAVTGGTGHFKSAHGVLWVIQQEAGLKFVFKLLL